MQNYVFSYLILIDFIFHMKQTKECKTRGNMEHILIQRCVIEEVNEKACEV